ncbi:hypothetical protein LFYK43_07280 [Ligilactobacillus salitolerans]|uniref:Transposase DDE domain-containing protein n=1 Tax=Ligilactobacillus salitolerans TaxID=1808352 RepID=A0A401IRV8_9LACO|nr:hypothetical protein LFYK43_07280 [Ligilactobacillus salitolerans]
MSTLQQVPLNFNKNLVISNTGGTLTNDGGLLLVSEFMHQINFSQLVKDNLHFQEERKYFKHSKNHLFQQLLMQLLAGYSNDTAANTLAKDVSFKLALDQLVSSQPTLSRYINRISENELDGVARLSQKLAQLVIKQRQQAQLILDLDSTHSDTYGKQKAVLLMRTITAMATILYWPLTKFPAASWGLNCVLEIFTPLMELKIFYGQFCRIMQAKMF